MPEMFRVLTTASDAVGVAVAAPPSSSSRLPSGFFLGAAAAIGDSSRAGASCAALAVSVVYVTGLDCSDFFGFDMRPAGGRDAVRPRAESVRSAFRDCLIFSSWAGCVAGAAVGSSGVTTGPAILEDSEKSD